MSEITPAVAADGASNGYAALNAKLGSLQAAADALQERVAQVARRMQRNADAADRLADLCAAAEVDPRHVGAIGDIALTYRAVAKGSTSLVSAADVLSQAAGHARTQHQGEYGGIHAAATSARARQARPGFYRQH